MLIYTRRKLAGTEFDSRLSAQLGERPLLAERGNKPIGSSLV